MTNDRFQVVRVFQELKLQLNLPITTQTPMAFVDRLSNHVGASLVQNASLFAKQRTERLLRCIMDKGIIHVLYQPAPFAIAAFSLVCEAFQIEFDESKALKDFARGSHTKLSIRNCEKGILGYMLEMTLPLKILNINQLNVKSNLRYLLSEIDVIQHLHEAMLNVQVIAQRFHQSNCKDAHLPQTENIQTVGGLGMKNETRSLHHS